MVRFKVATTTNRIEQVVNVSIPKWYDLKPKHRCAIGDTGERFNSKMVRFKEVVSLSPNPWVRMFQFQNGTI